MSDAEQSFKDALDHAKWRFTTQGLKASDRAFEYGTLVVRNAFLVSGGGLFFIPTMVGLSADIDLSYAFTAGLLFALSVLVALLGNYIIHINWTLHVGAWESIYEIEKIHVRKAFSRSLDTDAAELVKAQSAHEKANTWIGVSFWLPHLLVAIFLGCLIGATYFLYLAFGVVWNGETP